jgi:hypothetical protein
VQSSSNSFLLTTTSPLQHAILPKHHRSSSQLLRSLRVPPGHSILSRAAWCNHSRGYFEVDELQMLWYGLSMVGCKPHGMQIFHHPLLEESNLLLYDKQALCLGHCSVQGEHNTIVRDPWVDNVSEEEKSPEARGSLSSTSSIDIDRVQEHCKCTQTRKRRSQW